ncbi:hypothetical protein VTJ83DRAFT_4911 [Remersonia thermophila]|uniref:Mob1 family protein n=1 Tax=Remersonia thermophila TaxID=72144 RepID=A0ABR4DC81_9PEZI
MSLPPSSPRLPSPPPPAEIQITPKSPLMGPKAAQVEQSAIDTNSKRRIHPGTRACDMAAGPPLVPLHELDSPFQLQEHLAALHFYHTASKTSPVSRDAAKLLATPPPGTDKTLWLYELCRFLIAQCNTLIVGFLFDTPACSAATCPEMRAGEWQFLCAVHDAPKSCCAIDYCCHTLDWAANVVTNPKIFPSRFVVDPHDKNTAIKNLVNIFRRLHRIFAHAWFQHRGVFWTLENQTGLYVFFKTVCDIYDLLPAENYKLPPEAEGLDPADSDKASPEGRQQQHPLGPISIARPPHRDADNADFSGVSRTNTRRHIKSSPSVGSAVATVPEADEDESTNDLTNRLKGIRLSPSKPSNEEDADLSTIPMIVDHATAAAAQPPVRPSSVVPPPGAAAATATAIPENGAPDAESVAHDAKDPSAMADSPEPTGPSQPPPTTSPTDSPGLGPGDDAASSSSSAPPSSAEPPASSVEPEPAAESAGGGSPTEPAEPGGPAAQQTEASAEPPEEQGEATVAADEAAPQEPGSESPKKDAKPDRLAPPEPAGGQQALEPESPVDKAAVELGLFVTAAPAAAGDDGDASGEEKTGKDGEA